MKNNQLIIDIERLKLEETWQKLGEEEMYTIQMQDFFIMPDIDFKVIAQEDPNIRVLFN